MKKMDKIMILVIVCVSVLSLFIIRFVQSTESEKIVIIKHDGQILKTFTLNEDTSASYTFESEEMHNQVVIKNGKVTVSESNCKDQTCVKTGSISQIGESIVCLPHKFSVEIYASEGTSSTDDETKLDDIAN